VKYAFAEQDALFDDIRLKTYGKEGIKKEGILIFIISILIFNL
jgi:hypothetical protein